MDDVDKVNDQSLGDLTQGGQLATGRKTGKDRGRGSRSKLSRTKPKYDSGSESVGEGGVDVHPTDKLKKRLARKAELARASRRRKKAYVQDLEEKVASLTQRVAELTAQLSKLKGGNAAIAAIGATTRETTRPARNNALVINNNVANNNITTAAVSNAGPSGVVVATTITQASNTPHRSLHTQSNLSYDRRFAAYTTPLPVAGSTSASLAASSSASTSSSPPPPISPSLTSSSVPSSSTLSIVTLSPGATDGVRRSRRETRGRSSRVDRDFQYGEGAPKASGTSPPDTPTGAQLLAAVAASTAASPVARSGSGRRTKRTSNGEGEDGLVKQEDNSDDEELGKQLEESQLSPAPTGRRVNNTLSTDDAVESLAALTTAAMESSSLTSLLKRDTSNEINADTTTSRSKAAQPTSSRQQPQRKRKRKPKADDDGDYVEEGSQHYDEERNDKREKEEPEFDEDDDEDEADSAWERERELGSGKRLGRGDDWGDGGRGSKRSSRTTNRRSRASGSTNSRTQGSKAGRGRGQTGGRRRAPSPENTSAATSVQSVVGTNSPSTASIAQQLAALGVPVNAPLSELADLANFANIANLAGANADSVKSEDNANTQASIASSLLGLNPLLNPLAAMSFGLGGMGLNSLAGLGLGQLGQLGLPFAQPGMGSMASMLSLPFGASGAGVGSATMGALSGGTATSANTASANKQQLSSGMSILPNGLVLPSNHPLAAMLGAAPLPMSALVGSMSSGTGAIPTSSPMPSGQPSTGNGSPFPKFAANQQSLNSLLPQQPQIQPAQAIKKKRKRPIAAPGVAQGSTITAAHNIPMGSPVPAAANPAFPTIATAVGFPAYSPALGSASAQTNTPSGNTGSRPASSGDWPNSTLSNSSQPISQEALDLLQMSSLQQLLFPQSQPTRNDKPRKARRKVTTTGGLLDGVSPVKEAEQKPGEIAEEDETSVATKADALSDPLATKHHHLNQLLTAANTATAVVSSGDSSLSQHSPNLGSARLSVDGGGGSVGNADDNVLALTGTPSNAPTDHNPSAGSDGELSPSNSSSALRAASSPSSSIQISPLFSPHLSTDSPSSPLSFHLDDSQSILGPSSHQTRIHLRPSDPDLLSIAPLNGTIVSTSDSTTSQMTLESQLLASLRQSSRHQ